MDFRHSIAGAESLVIDNEYVVNTSGGKVTLSPSAKLLRMGVSLSVSMFFSAKTSDYDGCNAAINAVKNSYLLKLKNSVIMHSIRNINASRLIVGELDLTVINVDCN